MHLRYLNSRRINNREVYAEWGDHKGLLIALIKEGSIELFFHIGTAEGAPLFSESDLLYYLCNPKERNEKTRETLYKQVAH